ncbi:DUF1707 domain-containing protein [Nocardia sp. SYP-A9097]|uniref:DUF1707 SHOCT-like domain-containing protein n=1 Tax=Nocardia sp. SYP-A9097 TaxID=2663237 RepID=UPI00129A886E|nr:DUF1707 domain-containing protein [Nocardia sp. SYP-A9097]MRH93155.1 DUF1707 domain-containing protein [Nocardia sp. SYP-A9097]
MADFRNQGLRARDADRVDACTMLDNARATGELTEAEHAGRTASAMTARTFGDLDKLIGDLQIPKNLVGTPLLRPQRRNELRRWRIVIAAVSIAALVGALGGCIARNTVSKPDIPDPTTGAGLASFIAAYQDHYGDSLADQVSAFPKYVVVDRRVAGAQRDDYLHYDGSFQRLSDTSRSSGNEQVDLSKLDLPKLAGLLAGAPQTLHLPGGKITHINIECKPGQDPVVSIYVDNGPKSGRLAVTAKGEPVELNLPQ